MDNRTNTAEAAERRTEKRYDTGDCTATIVMADPDTTCRGVVMDVSRSGLRLRASCGIRVHGLVTVQMGGISVSGRVHRCTRNSDGTFDTGVLIGD